MKTIELTRGRHTLADFERLRRVLACASKDATRPAINRVLAEKVRGGVVITATDGKRLRSDRFKMTAESGIYDIRVNNAKAVFLCESADPSPFPDYRQAVPSAGRGTVHAIEGRGGKFVVWASAALGCYIDPALCELGDDEEVTLYIQRQAAHLSPALVKNKTTTLVVMPINVEGAWTRELAAAIKEGRSANAHRKRKAA